MNPLKGQIWTYHPPRTSWGLTNQLWLVVVSVSLDGEVVFRPNGSGEIAKAKVMFEEQCPFLRLGDNLAANIAWDMWKRMYLAHDPWSAQWFTNNGVQS